jgi:hypothetical protein
MSVLDTPTQYNTFTLDGDTSPGIAVITSGGERKIEIADQGQLLTRGKNTVVRSIENIVVTYGFRLWLPEHFAKRDAWISMLEEGARRTQVRVYKLRDLNMPWLTQVCLQGFKPQTPIAPGGPWDWQLVLHEYNRIKTFGGPLKPPVTGTAIADATAKRDAALKALNNAVNAGKTRRAAGQ